MRTIEQSLYMLQLALFSGQPEEVTGGPSGHSVLHWDVCAIGDTKQWTARGLAIWLTVPILHGRALAVEAHLILNEDRGFVDRVESWRESCEKNVITTHHVSLEDFINYCANLRKEASEP